MNLELQQALADAIKKSDSFESTHDDVDGGAAQQDNNDDPVVSRALSCKKNYQLSNPFVRQSMSSHSMRKQFLLLSSVVCIDHTYPTSTRRRSTVRVR